MSEEKHKDSCKYAVDISKQFVTLAVATIGFLVSLIIAKKTFFLPSINKTLLILLGVSVLFGVLFLMSVVAHINQSKNYNVYTRGLRLFSGAQIALFFIAIIIIAWSTFNYLGEKKEALTATKNDRVSQK